MKRLFFALTAAAALWTAACGGGGGSNVQPPPPQGKYSLASLNGTYAFMTSGEVETAGGEAQMARVGSFVANGQGGILGGVEDVNIAGSPSGAVSITGGSYTVNADGHGSITFNLNGTNVVLGIVLTSTSDGLMIDETSNANQASTGSGNFILQDPTVCSSPVTSVTGPYVFDFAGLDSSGLAESFVGEFSVNGGQITTGIGDINDNATLFSAISLAGAGSFTAGTPAAGPDVCGRGQAIITNAATGQQTYAYYVVNSTRVRFINIAGGEMLSGDAVAQSASVPTSTANFTGGFVFELAGSSNNGGLTQIGRFSASSGMVMHVLADVDNAGVFQKASFSGGTITFDSVNPGRGQIAFASGSGFPYTFQFYLSSATAGVVQDISPASGNPGFGIDVSDGSLAAQSGNPFSSSNITGTYGMNWSGLVTAGGVGITDEEDLLAQSTITSLALSGTVDLFQFTSLTATPSLGLGVGGNIAIGGDGAGDDGMRSQLTVNLTGANPITFVIYFISPQQAFFAINAGQTHLDAGFLKMQQ